MPRRPGGATVVQAAKRLELALHTVRGFFAGLKKRWNITVMTAKRSRLPGPTTRLPRAATPPAVPSAAVRSAQLSVLRSSVSCAALVSEIECFGNSLPR